MEHFIAPDNQGQTAKEGTMQEIGLALSFVLLITVCACADQMGDYNAATIRADRAPHAQAMASQFRSGQSQALVNEVNPGAP